MTAPNYKGNQRVKIGNYTYFSPYNYSNVTHIYIYRIIFKTIKSLIKKKVKILFKKKFF